MSISQIAIGCSIVSGIFAGLLLCFTLFFEKNKKRSRNLLIWSFLFLVSSFTATEYAFWLEGNNLFSLLLHFAYPLILYFGVWIIFLIWLFEIRKERKVWIILLLLSLIAVIFTMNCMNCISF